MDRNAAKLLGDALDGCIAIERHPGQLDLAEYRNNRTVRSAVMWEFTIIGEAIHRLRQEHPEVAAGVSEVNRIVAFRNVLVHGYHSVDDQELWRVITDALPTLRQELESLTPDR